MTVGDQLTNTIVRATQGRVSDRRRSLDGIEAIFARHTWITPAQLLAARTQAEECTGEGLEHARGPEEERLLLAAFAAEVFSGLAIALAAHPRDAARLVRELEAHGGVPRPMLAKEALRSPALFELEPAQAIIVSLSLLSIFAPLRGISLWTLDATSRVRCLHHTGDAKPTNGARKLARALLAGDVAEPGEKAELFGLPVRRSGQRLATLVARTLPRQRERCYSVMQMSLPALATVIERDALLTRNVSSERTLVEATERRLIRLGFDLHDGPLQDLVLLGEDLRLFDDQLARVLGSGLEDRLLRGRLEDFDSQLVQLEAALRRISSSSHATVLVSVPLAEALRNLTEAFATRTQIQPELNLKGDVTRLSPSQRIALLSIVQEGLNNIREHSRAEHAKISINIGTTEVQAQVMDDGRGFDVETAVVSAARRGRMGLAGAHERARLLGGQCRIESKPGGPTVISVTLPHWKPLADTPQDAPQRPIKAA